MFLFKGFKCSFFGHLYLMLLPFRALLVVILLCYFLSLNSSAATSLPSLCQLPAGP